MPVWVDWDNAEKTIVHQVIRGEWDLNEFYVMVDASRALMSEVNHRVDIIMNLSDPASVGPTNLMSAMNRVIETAPKNIGFVVIVRASPFIRSVITVACQNMPEFAARIHYVDFLPEVYPLLKTLNTPHQTD